MTVNYYLDTTSSAVLAVVQHKGKKFRVSTGEVIKPVSHWDTKQQKVKSSFKDYEDINKKLSSHKDNIKKIIRDYQTINNTVPTLDYVKNQINIDPNSNPKTFADCMDKFLERSLKENKKSTYTDYNYVFNTYKSFQKDKKITLSFTNIDHITIELLKTYLVQGGRSPITVKKHLRYFILLLNFAKRNGYIKYFEEHLFEFKAAAAQGRRVYLTLEEIKRIEALKDLSPSLDRARKTFLFQCYVGLRYSDLKTLRKENIQNNHIDCTMHKTSTRIYVPMGDSALALLHKCENDHPRRCFDSYNMISQNDYIKDLCKEAKITQNVAVVRYVGKKRIDETFEKWELVGTHSGRRSFATNFILQGGRIEILSKLMGHSDIGVTQRYFRHTPEVIAEIAKRYMN